MPIQKGNSKYHTRVKHLILDYYLKIWFPIIVSRYNQLLFIDGFCGDGKGDGDDLGSPLIALNTANGYAEKTPDKIFHFIFIDESKKNIDELQKLVKEKKYPENIRIYFINDKFELSINNIMDEINYEDLNMPSFAFIDPYGYSQINYDILKRLLSKNSAELLINLMWGYMKAYENPQIHEAIKRTYGFNDAELENFLKSNQKEKWVQTYIEKFENYARYHLNFTMYNVKRAPIYDLVFLTKNYKGFTTMKEALWKADPYTGGQFRNSTENFNFLFEDLYLQDLISILVNKYSHTIVSSNEIKNFIEAETKYLDKHKKQALDYLDDNNKIKVHNQKRKYTYNNCKIEFI